MRDLALSLLLQAPLFVLLTFLLSARNVKSGSIWKAVFAVLAGVAIALAAAVAYLSGATAGLGRLLNTQTLVLAGLAAIPVLLAISYYRWCNLELD
jgi:hypothetical protein